MAEMAHFSNVVIRGSTFNTLPGEFSNVLIHGSTFNSIQGDLHINNIDPEPGMQNFRSVQRRILIDDPMKDFIP